MSFPFGMKSADYWYV